MGIGLLQVRVEEGRGMRIMDWSVGEEKKIKVSEAPPSGGTYHMGRLVHPGMQICVLICGLNLTAVMDSSGK